MPESTDHLNLADHLLDRRLAEGRGDRTAIRTDTGTLTYRDVAALSARMAHLVAARGVRPEERVVIALPDTPSFVGALFGIVRHGAVVVMVNPDLPVDQIRYFFEYTRARAAFVDAARLATFSQALADLSPPPTLIPVGAPETDGALAAASPDYVPFPSHRDDAAMWLFSGGTTGRPKAVVQTHRSYANTTRLYGQGVLGLTEHDITISVPKLFFGYAAGSNLFFPFSVGASIVLFPERCTADALFAQIRRHRPTVLVNVPTMVQQMVAHAHAASADVSSLRLATSAGEALPVELHERWNHAFGVDLLDGLGTAEMWHIFLSNRPGDVVPGTLGRVVPGFEVKLCDADGAEVPAGEVGALWVKGDSRAIAYWQRMDDTVHAFRGEWYVSGDMLRRNPDGTFVYCGRADDMLKVSGKWLSPGELENCLLQHQAVREVAVVGVRNEDGLVKPVAFVVSDVPSPALGVELQAFAKSRLEPYKYPREVRFLDALPRTHLGKVNRHELAASS
jgi:benzoate-CoA ligase family protein